MSDVTQVMITEMTEGQAARLPQVAADCAQSGCRRSPRTGQGPKRRCAACMSAPEWTRRAALSGAGLP